MRRTRTAEVGDLFARAALEGFLWAILGGVLGKLFWDSVRPPLFFYPLALLDLLLLWDASRHYLLGAGGARTRNAGAGALREVRIHLGIDPAPARAAPGQLVQETR